VDAVWEPEVEVIVRFWPDTSNIDIDPLLASYCSHASKRATASGYYKYPYK
jgi:hypothetical protein